MKDYSCDETGKVNVTVEMIKDFENLGYVVVRSLLNENERRRLLQTVEEDPSFTLLGGEVYHYHSKIIKKDAQTGGMHVWHQDYGYWYKNGCLNPSMGTTFLALDRAVKKNGCLQILEGSHKMGRIDHQLIGGQLGIDEERMAHILKRISPTHVELEPGDVLFFHSNVIHKSAQNHSDDRRWAFLCAYNRRDNNPVIPHHHPQYSKMTKTSSSAIMTCPTIVNVEEKDFYSISRDVSLQCSSSKK